MNQLHPQDDTSLKKTGTASMMASNFRSSTRTRASSLQARSSPGKTKRIPNIAISRAGGASSSVSPKSSPFQKTSPFKQDTPRRRRPTVREIRGGLSPSPVKDNSNSLNSVRSNEINAEQRDDYSHTTTTNFEHDDSSAPRSALDQNPDGDHQMNAGNSSKGTDSTEISSQVVSILTDGSDTVEGQASPLPADPSPPVISSKVEEAAKIPKTEFSPRAVKKKLSTTTLPKPERNGCSFFECSSMSINANRYMDVKKRFFADNDAEKNSAGTEESIATEDSGSVESRIQMAYEEGNIDALFRATRCYMEDVSKEMKQMELQLEQETVKMSTSKRNMLFEENIQLKKQVRTLMEYIELREADIQQGMCSVQKEINSLLGQVSTKISSTQKNIDTQIDRSKSLTAELRKATKKYSE